MMAHDNDPPKEELSLVKGKDSKESKEVEKSETPGDVNELTPEEQMARFEEELKNSDWGHQPC